MATHGYFYGLEGNKFYKIYVTDTALHGAKVASATYDEASVRATMHHFGLIGWLIGGRMARSTVRKRQEKEAQYDALLPGAPDFMSADKDNFSLGQSTINSIGVNPKRNGLKKVFNSGAAVEIVPIEGKKRRFALVGDQNAEYVKNLIARAIPQVQMVE